MRAIARALVGALTLTSAGVAAAQDMSNMKGMSTSAAPAAKHGHAVGVIKAIDAKAGTLTIQHGPIPGVGWPAMTMTFKVDASASMSGLKVGQPVAFDVKAKGMSGEITALRPQS